MSKRLRRPRPVVNLPFVEGSCDDEYGDAEYVPPPPKKKKKNKTKAPPSSEEAPLPELMTFLKYIPPTFPLVEQKPASLPGPLPSPPSVDVVYSPMQRLCALIGEEDEETEGGKDLEHL